MDITGSGDLWARGVPLSGLEGKATSRLGLYGRGGRPPGRRELHWGRLARIGAGNRALGRGTAHWGREPRIGVGGLPAPMTCCLPRWGRRPSCPVLDAGPCPRSCWLAARRVGDGLHRLVRVGCYRAFLPRGSCASSFASDAAVSKGSLGPGEGRGLFCESSGRDPQHGAGPGEGTGGSFASEVELLKGYRHFASVITLAKCKSGGVAVKPGPWSARAQAPVGQVRSARWPRSPRRADSGALGPGAAAPVAPPAAPSRAPRAALGQASPHWGRLITCPNAQFPTPMACFLPRCG